MPEPLTKIDVRDTLGRPMGDLRLSVIDKCNLRCTYCMPESEFGASYQFLKNDALLTFDEITRLTKSFVQLGVSKVRLTGGEPLLRKNLPDLIAMLLEVEGLDDLALTTNGLLLADQAQALYDAGLHRITVSIDSLNPEVAARMNGRAIDPGDVLRAIDHAASIGFDSIKINAVIQRGVNDHTLLDLLQHFRNTRHIVRLIEYMDVGNRNGWKLDDVVSAREMVEKINDRFPLKPIDKQYNSEVAARYAYEDGAGEIGLITSVTNTFCGDCTRARVSADGQLYTCLFAGQGVDLKAALRDSASDTELTELLASTWSRRTDRYSELRASMTEQEQSQHKIEMYQIGG
ncbi:MAG: GTP 3',8-cyclase MoaA [Candidatus Hydrogenedentota bacterium]